MGFLWHWNNPYSKPMLLLTRFFVWFPTPTFEKSFFYCIFVQMARVYQCMKFDPIPDHPNNHQLVMPHLSWFFFLLAMRLTRMYEVWINCGLSYQICGSNPQHSQFHILFGEPLIDVWVVNNDKISAFWLALLPRICPVQFRLRMQLQIATENPSIFVSIEFQSS